MRFAKIPHFLCSLVAASMLSTGPSWSQTKPLSAREIFYSAPSEQPAATKKSEAPKSQKKAAPETAKAKPSVPPPTQPSAITAPSQVPLVQAAYTTTPLGIKYSILQRVGADYTEVSPDSVFHSGDRIRLRVEVNAAGYLYVISRGSSGTWKPLFPSPEVPDNRADRGVSYDIPSGYVFTFDEQAGQEKLFIVFSRQPEPNLEGLVYSLSSGQKPAETAQPSGGKVLLAQNMVNIDDGLVQKLRNVYARDLIIEKVDESSPAAPKEKAVYVVNPARSGDSRVVADVTLEHK
jgi:Domain of unknown function (DUF4384)